LSRFLLYPLFILPALPLSLSLPRFRFRVFDLILSYSLLFFSSFFFFSSLFFSPILLPVHLSISKSFLVGMQEEKSLIFRFWIGQQRWQKLAVAPDIRLLWPVMVAGLMDDVVVMSGSMEAELFSIQREGEQMMKMHPTGVAPFSAQWKREEAKEEGHESEPVRPAEIELIAGSGVLYGHWFIVPGDGNLMQAYVVSIKHLPLK
jgi:hypothetical protein